MLLSEFKEKVSSIELNDYSKLLNIGRKWEKIEDGNYNIKIAFLGSTSIQLITSVTRALLTKYNLYANIYEGQYNGILMDTLDYNSYLYKFDPDYIIILPDYSDIDDLKPFILESVEDSRKNIEMVIKKYINMWNKIHNKLPKCHIMFSNFVEPFYNSLGNLSCNYNFSQSSFLKQVNLELTNNKPAYVTLLDMEGLASYIGKKDWFDESSYFLNKSGFNLSYIGYVCDLIARQFEAFTGKVKKCLILDLDNTLWGGVVGDVGYNKINIDPNDPEGEAYLAFQKYIYSLKERGVILAVCSKNEEENAKEPFLKNDKMILKLNDFSDFIANWDDKATNIKRIARNLNLGLDSFVFVDDNPTERELIRNYLPEVKVIDLPEDVSLYVRSLDQAHCFEWNQITKEDIDRSKTYEDNKKRIALLDDCIDYEDYLKRLEMKCSFKQLTEENLPRFVQLVNKTNQFNLRTVRYNETEIIDMINNPKYKMYTVSLKDKFSDYGIIACIVLKIENKECFIENWVMSCRVFKKTVENYTIKKIIQKSLECNCNTVTGEYIETEKNKLIKDLYIQLGFKVDDNKEENRFILDNIEKYDQKYFIEEEL